MTAALGAFAPMVAAAAKKSSGSPMLLIFAVIGAAFYFLIYRPQQKKQKAARAAVGAFEVGDEVVTAGGIVGHVIDITDDRVTLETSVGASFVVLLPYVLRKLEPVVPPSDVVADSDDDVHGPPDEPGAAEADSTGHGASEGSGSPSPGTPDEPDVPGADRPPTS
jgi:preprotein translocase subunit YajC